MNDKVKSLDERLFGNVGSSIKKITKIIFWVETTIVLVFAAIMILTALAEEEGAYFGIAILSLILPVFFWLGSLTMYGFGEIIDRTIKISENTAPKAKED